MKYSSTVRTINVVIFALLLGGFTFLAIWFGFMTVPFQWWGGSGSPLGSDFPSTSFGLAAMFGIFGLAGAIVSLRGFVASVLSMLRGNDDELVLRSFGSYIGVGIIVAIYLLLNATWVYRLTSTNFHYEEIAFVCIVYTIAFIIVAFATLLPLSKIFGDHDRYNEIMRIISFTLGASTLAVAAVFFGPLINLLSHKATTANSDPLLVEFLVGTIIPFVASACFGFALLGYKKADRTGTVSKKNGFLFESGLFLTGGAIIAAGVIENIFQSKELKISLMASEVSARNANYLDFSIMSYIVGGLIVLAACYFAYQTALGSKAKLVKDE